MKIGSGDFQNLKIGTQDVQKVMLGDSLVWMRLQKPTGLNATSITKTSLTLSWGSSDGASYYIVERKLNSGSTWTVVNSNTSSLSQSVSGLTQGTSYDFRVGAYANGITVYSDIYTISTLDILYMVPSADVSVGDWTSSTRPTLWETVETPGDTSNWITSSNSNGSTCRLRFTSPVSSSPATLKVYRRKTTGNDPNFSWTLYRNSTQIQTLTTTLTSTSFIISQTTLTSNLVSGATYEIELTRSGGGNPSQRGVLEMAGLWIEY